MAEKRKVTGSISAADELAEEIADEIITDNQLTIERPSISKRIQSLIDEATAELREQLQLERDCVLRQQRELNRLKCDTVTK